MRIKFSGAAAVFALASLFSSARADVVYTYTAIRLIVSKAIMPVRRIAR